MAAEELQLKMLYINVLRTNSNRYESVDASDSKVKVAQRFKADSLHVFSLSEVTNHTGKKLFLSAGCVSEDSMFSL